MTEHSERQTRLSPDDQKELKSNLIGMFIFLIIGLLIFSFFFYAIPNNKGVLYVLIGFTVLFMGAIIWKLSCYWLDLSRNEKTVIRGFVTSQKTMFSRNNTQPRRQITIGNKKIYVSLGQMAQIKTGDFVEVHFCKFSNLALSSNLIHSGNPSAQTSTNFRQTKAADPQKASSAGVLSGEDRKVLAKLFRRSVRFEAYAMIFIGYLIIASILSGSYIIIIFIFPIPLGFIWLAYRLIKKIKFHYEDINAEGVLIYETLATDKSSASKRTHEVFTIETSLMRLNSGKEVYEKVRPVQPITIRVSRVHKRLIGVTLPSGEYVSN